jgi:exodeoxyribonuclease-3
VKIATWNVNGIRKREAELLELARREQPDVICLQETKASPEQLPESLTFMPEYHTFWHAAKKGYSGVSLHVRKATVASAPRFAHPPFDMESRMVHADVGDVVVASIYVPNGGKDFAAKMVFLRELVSFARRAREENRCIVLCGDFNVTREARDVHPSERKPQAYGQRAEERELFSRMLSEGALTDVSRALAPDDDALYSWWAPWREMRQRNIGWRLDYVLASPELSAKSCVTLREFGTSDHGPVVAVLE